MNFEEDEKLQALVILDSFTDNFKPLSLDRPECLLEILGRPLLDYNLEFLIKQNVEEIFLFCTNHYKTIKTYLDKSKWISQSDIHLRMIANRDCACLGDTIREIDLLFQTEGHLKSNFILFTAPCLISNNFKIQKHFEAHKARCKNDKKSIMTVMCYNNSNDVNLGRTASNAQNLTLVSTSNNCIVHYDNSDVTMQTIPLSVMEYLTELDQKDSKESTSLTKASTLKLYTSMLDTQIYLCSSYVLHMFSDNFDALTMSDFIHMIRADQISRYAIYMDKIDRQFGTYVALVNDLNSYYRQTLKLTQLISSFHLDYFLRYTSNKSFNITLKSNVKLGRNLNLCRNVFIDDNAQVDDSCELINCYVGKNVHLGANVKLSNAIILDNSIIGKNTIINACLIGPHVKINENLSICENTLLSSGCLVNEIIEKSGVYYVPIDGEDDDEFSDDEDDEKESKNEESKPDNLPNYRRFIYDKDKNDESDYELSDEENNFDKASLPSSETSSTKHKSKSHVVDTKHFYVWQVIKENDESDYGSDVSDDYEDEDDESDICSESGAIIADSDEITFRNEVKEIIKRGILENLKADNMIVEINSSKHANNIYIKDLFYLFSKSLLEIPLENKKIFTNLIKNSETASYLDLSKALFTKLTKLVQNYLSETKEAQYVFLDTTHEFFSTNSNLVDTAFAKLLHHINQECNLVEDEILIDWYEKKNKGLADSEKNIALNKLEVLIKWLKEAETESEEDEEDDDE